MEKYPDFTISIVTWLTVTAVCLLVWAAIIYGIYRIVAAIS